MSDQTPQRYSERELMIVVALVLVGALVFMCGAMLGATLSLLGGKALGDNPEVTRVIYREVTRVVYTAMPSEQIIPSATDEPSPTPIPTQPPTITPTPIIAAMEVPSGDMFSGVEGAECIPRNTGTQTAATVNVTSGDTVEVMIEGQTFSLRYIGVVTPQADQQDGALARDRNQELVTGKDLMLVKDISDMDASNSLPRYVIAGGTFVNYELIRRGFARAGSQPPDTACETIFLSAEAAARSEGLGIWSANPATATPQQESINSQIYGNVKITALQFQGQVGSNETDEYVEIKNLDATTIQLEGWALEDSTGHRFTFPRFDLKPGKVCRIYTNENHLEWCRFNFKAAHAQIWNNEGDCARLSGNKGNFVDAYCYLGGRGGRGGKQGIQVYR